MSIKDRLLYWLVGTVVCWGFLVIAWIAIVAVESAFAPVQVNHERAFRLLFLWLPLFSLGWPVVYGVFSFVFRTFFGVRSK
jgi:hypothetical protein